MNARTATADTDVLPTQVQAPAMVPAVPMIPTTEADRLLAIAIDKNLPLDHLERLLVMRDKLRAEAAKGAYLDAMARFQAECPVIDKGRTAQIKTKSGAQFSYKYAEIGAIVKVAGPLIGKHGLSYIIRCDIAESGVPAMVATVTISHILGHSEQSSFNAPVDVGAVVNDMQKYAAAATFAKRQAFCNAFGILTHSDDNDGAYGGGDVDRVDRGEAARPQTATRASPKAEQKDDGTPATESQVKLIKAKLESAGLSTADMKKQFGFDPAGMTKAKVNTVLDWIRNPVPAA